MKKSKLTRYFLMISISTLVAILFTIIQSSYSHLMDPISKAKTSTMVKNFNPQINSELIDQLESKKSYLPTDLNINQLLSAPTVSTESSTP